jgi:hypothetical protein
MHFSAELPATEARLRDCLPAAVGHTAASRSQKGMPPKPSHEKPTNFSLFPRLGHFDAAVGVTAAG